MPQRGDKICIGGKTYEFVPAGEGGSLRGAPQAAIPGYLSEVADTGIGGTVDTSDMESTLQDIRTAVVAIAQAVNPFYDYVGVYRSLREVVIPGRYSNFEIDFGFPVRQFYFDAPAALTVRLNASTSDPIEVDAASSPFALNDLPNKLAFTKIYVSNENPVDIKPYIFVMG